MRFISVPSFDLPAWFIWGSVRNCHFLISHDQLGSWVYSSMVFSQACPHRTCQSVISSCCGGTSWGNCVTASDACWAHHITLLGLVQSHDSFSAHCHAAGQHVLFIPSHMKGMSGWGPRYGKTGLFLTKHLCFSLPVILSGMKLSLISVYFGTTYISIMQTCLKCNKYFHFSSSHAIKYWVELKNKAQHNQLDFTS